MAKSSTTYLPSNLIDVNDEKKLSFTESFFVTLIFLPGFLDCSEFEHVVDLKRLAAKSHFNFASIDMGNLHSTNPQPEKYCISNYLDLLAQTIDYIHQISPDQKIFVVGHSMGAFTALCASNNSAIDAIVAVMPPAQIPGNSRVRAKLEDWKTQEKLTFTLPESTTQINLPYTFVTDAARYDVQSSIKNSDIPTFFIAGRNDLITPPQIVAQLARLSQTKGNFKIVESQHNYRKSQSELSRVNTTIIKFLETIG